MCPAFDKNHASIRRYLLKEEAMTSLAVVIVMP